jgi:hypothetical protein
MSDDYQKLINILEQIEIEIQELEKDVLQIFLFEDLID